MTPGYVVCGCWRHLQSPRQPANQRLGSLFSRDRRGPVSFHDQPKRLAHLIPVLM